MKRTYIKYILAIAISVAATSLYGQKKETRNLDDFTAISMGISGDLHIKQGSKCEVIIEGDEETLAIIETSVTGDKLKISTKNSSWWKSYSKVNIYVTIKEFKGLSISGSGDANSDGFLKGENVDLSVSGSGDISLDLEASAIDCSISGSGSISLKGQGKTGHLTISGSGELDAVDFELETLKIRISGSGSAEVYATKEIDSHISGSGRVHYKGNPDKIVNHSSGSGSLKKM